MTVSERLREVRGPRSRKEIGARLRVHVNTVANYEHGRQPPVAYLTAIAERYGIRLTWLVTGQGPMRIDDDPPTLFTEKLTYSISIAIDRVYGNAADSPSLDQRARVLRAVWKYVVGLGMTEQNLPDIPRLVGIVELTGELLGVPGPKVRRAR
jgi:transcriptional regulator with XRE-family HTH domain